MLLSEKLSIRFVISMMSFLLYKAMLLKNIKTSHMWVFQGIMSPQLSSLLFLVVGISMAITPWLAAGGQLIASRFELHDVRSFCRLKVR